MTRQRHDFAFPFRIDPGSRLGQRVDYETHVRQLVIQLLLTSPGERIDRPEFGCGLRALVFAANSDALAATAEMLVRQALSKWLSTHLAVETVEVQPPSEATEQNQIVVRVEYSLVSTRVRQRVELQFTR